MILFLFFVCFFLCRCKRFCLQIKPGGLIRVHTSVLQPTSLYKSLFISEETTSDELLTLLLSCYNLDEPVEQFSLYEVRFIVTVVFCFLWQEHVSSLMSISCVSSTFFLTDSTASNLIKENFCDFRPPGMPDTRVST